MKTKIKKHKGTPRRAPARLEVLLDELKPGGFKCRVCGMVYAGNVPCITAVCSQGDFVAPTFRICPICMYELMEEFKQVIQKTMTEEEVEQYTIDRFIKHA